VSALGIHRYDDVLLSNLPNKAGEKRTIDAAVPKRGAADDHLLRTSIEDALSSCGRADAAAYPHAHWSFAAELADQARVVSAAHGRIKIDDVKQGIIPKAVEKAKNVLNS
jgi:hypothetical protein